jgi:hypothetical protein
MNRYDNERKRKLELVPSLKKHNHSQKAIRRIIDERNRSEHRKLQKNHKKSKQRKLS